MEKRQQAQFPQRGRDPVATGPSQQPTPGNSLVCAPLLLKDPNSFPREREILKAEVVPGATTYTLTELETGTDIPTGGGKLGTGYVGSLSPVKCCRPRLIVQPSRV